MAATGALHHTFDPWTPIPKHWDGNRRDFNSKVPCCSQWGPVCTLQLLSPATTPTPPKSSWSSKLIPSIHQYWVWRLWRVLMKYKYWGKKSKTFVTSFSLKRSKPEGIYFFSLPSFQAMFTGVPATRQVSRERKEPRTHKRLKTE